MPTTARGNPRARMVRSAAVSMRGRGVEATSFSQVLVDSGAPRGSLYHYFPRGRTQMLEEATRFADEYVANQFTSCFGSGPPSAGVSAFADIYLDLLRHSDFGEGCPVLVAGLEGERAPGVRDAAGEAFQRWVGIVAGALVEAGVTESRASSLGALVVSGLEGGIALSRAQRSLQPLTDVAHELGAFLDAVVG